MSDIDLFTRQENEVLKKEKHELQHKIIDLRQSKEELQDKIDKAIEYIKVEYLSKFDDFESPLRMTNEEDWEKILKILGDKE